MMELKISQKTANPGDYVFVAVRNMDTGRVKPEKVQIGKLVITIEAEKCRVDHYDKQGNRLPEIYDDYFTCDEAIGIIEKYSKLKDQELEALKEKQKNAKETK